MAEIKASPDWGCYPEEDADTKEFYRQSVDYRGPDRHRKPGKYFPVIRVPASQLWQPLCGISIRVLV
jgi:hypothetical protein